MTGSVHVLLIEDDPFLSELASKKFIAAGFRLSYFNNAEDALVGLPGLAPDIILLDILLPRLNGFDFLQTIKGDEKLKKIPVVILSNLGSQLEIDRGMKLGAEAYLVKANVTLDEIVVKVKEVAAKHLK